MKKKTHGGKRKGAGRPKGSGKKYWVGYNRSTQKNVATLCIQDISRLENAYPFDAYDSAHAIAQYIVFMNSEGMAQQYFESFHP